MREGAGIRFRGWVFWNDRRRRPMAIKVSAQIEAFEMVPAEEGAAEPYKPHKTIMMVMTAEPSDGAMGRVVRILAGPTTFVVRSGDLERAIAAVMAGDGNLDF
jgi:hypothetical protein